MNYGKTPKIELITTKFESGLRICASLLHRILQTKLSKQKAITNFLAQVIGSIHCGIGNDVEFTENKLNERISAPNS
jgi:hypothetical protein